MAHGTDRIVARLAVGLFGNLTGGMQAEDKALRLDSGLPNRLHLAQQGGISVLLTDEDVFLNVAIDAFQIAGDICERDFLAPPNGCYRLVAKLNPAAVEPLIRIISGDFQQAAA
ncbi:hypothetical protein HKX42_12000, partial [Salinisphaera sp. USBA-960]|nr:hypothetical protein [Salifodinibacter halophilus]